MGAEKRSPVMYVNFECMGNFGIKFRGFLVVVRFVVLGDFLIINVSKIFNYTQM